MIYLLDTNIMLATAKDRQQSAGGPVPERSR